ncbi:MAG: RNA 2',3'-cyclic phosphodiesterase [Actinomycetota bacterium]
MRLFIAIQVPDSVRDECARVAALMEPAVSDARWVPPKNIHLTLAFIGEAADPDPIFEAVERAAETIEPMKLRCGGVGCFPNARRARVIWVGLTGDADRLSSAARAIQSELGTIGFLFEDRPFSGHLTIARLKIPSSVDVAISVEPIEFSVREIAVMRSKLARPAPSYEEVRSYRL